VEEVRSEHTRRPAPRASFPGEHYGCSPGSGPPGRPPSSPPVPPIVSLLLGSRVLEGALRSDAQAVLAGLARPPLKQTVFGARAGPHLRAWGGVVERLALRAQDAAGALRQWRLLAQRAFR
jgi:hypothetical protein